MKNGWIKIHRKLLDNPICQNPKWAWLWIIILLKANHETNYFIWNGKKQVCERGQFLTGRTSLAKESHLSPSLVERVLTYLENEQQIGQQKFSKFRLITIKNYNQYQKSDNKRTADGQQTDTNKNDKNDKNIPTIVGSKDKLNKNIVAVIDSFKVINPSYRKFFSNKTQRGAVERLLEMYSVEELVAGINHLPEILGQKYAPRISTPLQLEDKMADLKIFLQQEQSKKIKIL